MDFIGGMNVVYYNKTQIINTLINNPYLLHHKKFMELFTGFLVACALEKEYKTTFDIGFPLKAIKKQDKPISGSTIAELIENTDLIADTDIDIYISDGTYPISCQITRIPKKRNKTSTIKDVLKLLEKKFNIQPDERLCLIINIEDKLDVTVDQLHEFLKDKVVPYGFILMIGKANEGKGKFMCWPIYPTMREVIEYYIDIPL